MGRLFAELFLSLLLFVAMIYGAYQVNKARAGSQPLKDISARPSLWFTDSRPTPDQFGWTAIGIVRVAEDNKDILEYHELSRLQDASPNYAARYDKLMDEAYEAARAANLRLRRR